MAFGKNQLKKPIPGWVIWTIIIISGLGGFFITWVSSSIIFQPITKAVIIEIMGLLIGISGFLAPFFGVKLPTNNTFIKQEDIVAADAHKKED